MRNTLLVFPNSNSMIDFLLIYRVGSVEANSSDLTLRGRLREKLIKTAITEYGAEIVKSYSYKYE